MEKTDGKRKESVRDSYSEHWEDIEIKTPIEKIPDEYPRETNRNVLVEIVCAEDDESANELLNQLVGLEYTVNKTDKDRKRMNAKDNVAEWISNVQKKIDEQNDCDGLLMIFSKVDYTSAYMKYIWNQFTSHACPKLKNKPKIFIFQILKKLSVADHTATAMNWLAAYETPAEADILIVYDKFSLALSQDLLENIYDNIKQYGSREDIISLVSIDSSPRYHPMVISTMTRKFYFELHPHRGQHHDLLKTQNKIIEYIDKLKINKMVAPTKTKKRGNSFRNFTKKLFTHSPKEEPRMSPDGETRSISDPVALVRKNSSKKNGSPTEGSTTATTSTANESSINVTAQSTDSSISTTTVQNPDSSSRSTTPTPSSSAAASRSGRKTSVASMTSKKPWIP